MKSKFSVRLKGREKDWDLNIEATEEEADALRADGFDVWRVYAVVPVWVPRSLRLPCIRVQELWNFLRLW